MTKKDFKVIANIIRQNTTGRYSDYCGESIDPDNLINDFVDFFATKNKSFNADKFRKACEK